MKLRNKIAKLLDIPKIKMNWFAIQYILLIANIPNFSFMTRIIGRQNAA